MSSRKQYPFNLIEPKWQQFWEEQQSFRAFNPGEVLPAEHPFAQRHGLEGKKVSAADLPPKFYVLDMFPYPSGAGLHVGHPEGYTATDILARYKRAAGLHVLHPMGWDAFGLPAEQYAIKTGQHPRQTTEANIANFTKQIKSLGFSYDWLREVDTTDPKYFRWTQWIFLKLYNSWFNPDTNKAEPIGTLKPIVDEIVSKLAVKTSPLLKDWALSAIAETQELVEQGWGKESIARKLLDSRRLAFISEAPVNWSPDLGTVLSNEEVEEWTAKGHTVVRKPMRQWMLRITAYADKLAVDLDTIDWSNSLKEMQRNWIGRSEGTQVHFAVANSMWRITVFTTRPDTLFGATYMVLSPEHAMVKSITTPEQREALQQYQQFAAGKSDLERTELAKEKTGVFTGAYAINPVNGEKIPIWIADYVLATYGTGAIMAVPAHDERDWEFAQKFNLAWRQVVLPSLPPATTFEQAQDIFVRRSNEHPDKLLVGWIANNGVATEGSVISTAFSDSGLSINSANAELSLNGLPTAEAKAKITAWLEDRGLGKKTINYKLRDWLFSRQRYWGEPFPIVWKKDANGNAYHEALPESALPLLPPALDDYKPTPDGQPPLARAQDWVNRPDGSVRETNTMPQWAGSCWYYLRFLDAGNDGAFVSSEAERYWMGVSGRGSKDESREQEGTVRPSALDPRPSTPGVDLYVGGTEHAVLHLLYARFWHKVLFDLGYVSTPEPFFKLVNQGLILGEDMQKMSKSRGNVVNPDDILVEYGADAFRLYEMFMGPLEMVKPWNTKGVEGVYRFLGRVWRLLVDEASEVEFEQALTTAETQRRRELLKLIKLHAGIKDAEPTKEQLKVLHACIKKVTEDLDGLRFNTAISAMMVFANDAMNWETKPVSVLREFLILLQPFAPHIAEELWSKLATQFSHLSPLTSHLSYQPWPKHDPALLVEDTLEIPVQVNGKLRDVIRVAATATQQEIEDLALKSEKAQQFMVGKAVKKVIVVPKKLVNIVVA